MLTVPTETAEETNIVNETLPIIENSQNEVKLVLKGSFGLSGVSADSVPPNIQPQQANGFEVIDGTTLYEEVKDPTTPQPIAEEISNTSAETPPLSVNTKKLPIIEDNIAKVEGKLGGEDKYTDKVVSNQDSQQIEVTSNKEKETTSKENIPDEGKTQETITENSDVKTEEEKISELLKKPVPAFFSSLGESKSSEEDVYEDEDYNETDFISAEENTVTDKEKDSTPILQMSPTSGAKNNGIKTDIKDEDVKNTENTIEKKNLPISEKVNPAMEYGINDTDLNVKEKDDLGNFKTSPIPGSVDLQLETANVPKTEELDAFNIQKGEVMKEQTNSVLPENLNISESVEKSTEIPTEDKMETSKIDEKNVKAIPDSVEDAGQPSMTSNGKKPEDEMETIKIVENKFKESSDSVEDLTSPSVAHDKQPEDETKLLEKGGLSDELSNTKDSSNLTVSSADDSKMTENSLVLEIESPSTSSEFKSDETNITDSLQDSNIYNATLAEETTKSQMETNVDVPSTPLALDTSIHKTEITESSITGDQSDIKVQGLNSFDSEISLMQKPEIINEINENNDVKESVDINSTEVYDSTENVEQTVEMPSKIETEDGFAGVVEEVTEDTVKIITEDRVVEEDSSGGIFSWFTSLFYGSDIPTNQIEEVSNVVTSHPEEQTENLWNEEVSNVVTSHPEEHTENLWKHPSHIEDSPGKTELLYFNFIHLFIGII